jgi:subtilase family serine protease
MPRNISGLIMAAQEVSNHQISPLSITQIRDYFSPPQSKVMAVKSLFHSLGMNITYVSPDGFMVSAVAPASLIESTFHVKLAIYNNSGDIYYAPMSLPSLPSSLNGLIIAGLTNFTQVHKNLIVLGDLSNHTLVSTQQIPSVLSAIYYDPQDLQGAYNVTPIISPNEKNVTIAVIEAYGDPNIQSDVATFDKDFNLPPANITVIPTGYYQPYQGLLTGWDVETALDVEAAHSLAPYAHIDVVVAPSATSNDLFQAIDYVVSQKLADVVSMSWGLPENLFGTSGFYTTFPSYTLNYPYANFYFALGTAEGITFLASSGDYGASGGTPTTYGGALFPASSPFVTSVGGTSLYVNVTSGYLWALNSTATYGYETAWSVDPLYGQDVSTGGGPSTLFPGVVTPTVSADANPYTGLAIVAEGQLLAIGGTSLASPTWAGIMADLDSRLGPLGDVNDLLPQVRYALHNVTFGYNGLYGPGYGTTGLGTPNAGLLLQALSKLPKGLQVSVSTNSTWLMQGSTLSIYAYVTYDGSPVTSGNFQAYLSNGHGYTIEAPLSFNYTNLSWTGVIKIPTNASPGMWSLEVKGSYHNTSGLGLTYVEVGTGIAIVLPPIPYPYGPALEINQPFNVAAFEMYPNGSPTNETSLTAHFIRDGKTILNVTLLPMGGGVYEGQGLLPVPEPQGTYLLVVNSSYGSAYTYAYFGLHMSAVILSPSNDPLPSASPGQNITLLATATQPSGFGLFTSNITAYIYSQSGKLMVSLPMTLAPDVVQFGQLNLFGYHEINFTIPSNFSPGFYTVVFRSTANTSTGLLQGSYNLSFYVAPETLDYEVNVNSLAFEGQTVKVVATISYPNGSPVTYGVFSATLEPLQLSFETLSLSEQVAVPLQFNYKLNQWIGEYTLPSVLSQPFYQGTSLSALSGPWLVEVDGVSPTGLNVISSPKLFNVMPYTYLGSQYITPSNASKVPIAIDSDNNLSISDAYIPYLDVSGLSVNLNNDIIGQLEGYNSSITVLSSSIHSINVTNSHLVIVSSQVSDSRVGITALNSTVQVLSSRFSNLSFAFDQVSSQIYTEGITMLNVNNISIVPPPVLSPLVINLSAPVSQFNFTVLGSSVKVLSVEVDNSPIQFSSAPVNGGVEVEVPFNNFLEPDGSYLVQVQASNGITYTLPLTLVNSAHQSTTAHQISSLTSQLTNVTNRLNSTITILYVALAVAIVGLIIAILLLLRRGGQ